MDATEDSDIKLQRASAELIGELKASLPAFLRHPLAKNKNGRGTVRQFVWWTTLENLIKLVNYFCIVPYSTAILTRGINPA